MVISLALSLGLTLLAELGAGLLLGLRRKQDLLLVALVNVLTNPVVVLVLNLACLYGFYSWYLVAALELAALLTEGLLYRGRLEYRKINPFLLSWILNSISYFGGLIL